MVLEKELVVITLIVIGRTLRVKADSSPLLLNLAETVIVRGNVVSLDFASW